MENKIISNLEPNVIDGFDIGNAYANFNGMRFATRVRVGKDLNIGNTKEEVHQVVYNNVNYIVGDALGKAVMGENKYNTDAFKICLLTAIALRGGRKRTIRAKISIGVPMENFERKAEEVAEIIKSWGTEYITVDDNNYKIDIVDFDVFIEGALPVLTEDESNLLAIDIGGGTVNVSEWDEMNLNDFGTIPASITKVYSNIATYLNRTHGGSFTSADVEKLIMKNKKTTYINQVETDISEIYKFIEEFVDGVVSSMEESKFKVSQVEKIEIFGGGAISTFEYFKKHFPLANMVEEPQAVNSKILKLVARR